MRRMTVIMIFDVGKTNKKIVLFDEELRLVHEQSERFEEIQDEDGFPCENIQALSAWIKEMFDRFSNDERYLVKAVNFSAYGASFVYLDEGGKVITPLYNYLKPVDPELERQFFDKYGDRTTLSRQTASPVLGSLNSGLQLYRMKYEKADLFRRVRFALHLPQYLAFILTGKVYSDITSVGCHTMLWDFERMQYHAWLQHEGIGAKLAPLQGLQDGIVQMDDGVVAGIGLHDSSAALIPYLSSHTEPFVLLSTGTWCITLNPFNYSSLTVDELEHDCLCYLSYEGTPVKASRLFAGQEHELQVKRLANHFNKPDDYYRNVEYNGHTAFRLKAMMQGLADNPVLFSDRSLPDFSSYEEAYHQLIIDIVNKQALSTSLAIGASLIKAIFVDGGFSQNPLYMHLLAAAFPGLDIFAASVPQASALGAAMIVAGKNNAPQTNAGLQGMRSYKPALY